MVADPGAGHVSERVAPGTQKPMTVIWDRPDEHRLVATVDGEVAQLQYERRDGQFVVTHTLVPDAISGRGIGSELARAAVEHARADDLVVVPECSFVAHWLREHPETAAKVGIEPPPF